MKTKPILRCVAVITLAFVALGTVFAGVSYGHVGITDATTDPNGVTTIEFSFDHGCGFSPTVRIEVKLPPEAVVVGTRVPAEWSVVETRDTFVAEGPQIPPTETVGFAVSLTNHDTSIDHLMPTIQICEAGTLAWIEPERSSNYPAPFLTATTEPVGGTTTTEPPSGEAPSEGEEELQESVQPEIPEQTPNERALPVWIAVGMVTMFAVSVVAGILWNRQHNEKTDRRKDNKRG